MNVVAVNKPGNKRVEGRQAGVVVVSTRVHEWAQVATSSTALPPFVFQLQTVASSLTKSEPGAKHAPFSILNSYPVGSLFSSHTRSVELLNLVRAPISMVLFCADVGDAGGEGREE